MSQAHPMWFSGPALVTANADAISDSIWCDLIWHDLMSFDDYVWRVHHLTQYMYIYIYMYNMYTYIYICIYHIYMTWFAATWLYLMWWDIWFDFLWWDSNKIPQDETMDERRILAANDLPLPASLGGPAGARWFTPRHTGNVSLPMHA